MKNNIRLTNLLLLLIVVFISNCKSSRSGNFFDQRDDKEYKWTKMEDGKIWMVSNLNYEHKGSVCYEEKSENCQKNGRLYSWSSIDSICPNGWRIPTDKEWWNMVTQKQEPYKHESSRILSPH